MQGSKTARWGFPTFFVALFVAVLTVILLAPGPGVRAADLPPGGTFADDNGNVHEGMIEAIAAIGITGGCNASGTLYCPLVDVRRDQMASFLARALDLPDSTTDWFSDDSGSTHEDNINKVADAGIALGTGGGLFDPYANVRRDQMASFLARAFGLPDSTTDWFSDDNGSTHEDNINKIADDGVTLGCDDQGHFCPADLVRRDQMASFLGRALDLEPIIPPPPDTLLIGAGDIANWTFYSEDTAEIIEAYPNATVFTTGDHAYLDGTAEQLAEYYEPTWGPFKARTRPSIGNHDGAEGGAIAYYDYFGANAGVPGEGFYSYDVDNWHIIVLNSECRVGGLATCDAQRTWLVADLADNGQACMAAYWHRPVFNSGEHSNFSDFAEEWAILDEAGVDVVMNGHDHNYQRYGLQDSTGTASSDGMREFVVGTGGAGLYEQRTTLPNLEEFYMGHGVLKLDLDHATYAWEFISTLGDYSDSGIGDCDPA